MKKSIVVIVLVVLVGILLTAASPVPPPTQYLKGTLHWERNNICGSPYHVPLPVMTNVYLTGNFNPGHGLLQGCQIEAKGFFYTAGQCRYFVVNSYGISCPATLSLSSSLSSVTSPTSFAIVPRSSTTVNAGVPAIR